MTTLPKISLAASAAGFVAGSIIDFGGFAVTPALMLVLPLAAVFFGLFLISFMLEKEMAQFDAEQAGHHEVAIRDETSDAKCKNCGNCQCQPRSKLIPATL